MQITTTGCVNGATPWLEIMESTAGTFEAMARNMRATIDQWRPLEVLVIAGFALLGLVQITQSGKRIFERRRLIALHNCRPPTTYPHKDPLGIDAIRDAIQAGHTKTYLERQYKQFSLYGTTFSSRFFTSQIINTIEPENIKAVLSTDFDYYVVGPRRRNAFEPLLGRSLFQLDGREWYHSRSLIQPCFDRARNTNLETFELHVQNLIKAIPMDGSTVDLGPLFFRFAADVATDCILGRSVGSLVKMSAMDEEFVNAIHNAQKGCENRWQWGGLANFFPQREFYCSVEIVHRYIERYVDEVMDYHRACSWEAGPQDSPKRSTNRDEATSKHHVFLHDLSKITGDRKVIRDELLMAFFAGSDTVAALLTSLFFMLAKRPDIWHHLRQEVEKIEGPPTLPELKAMSYHQWCIRESLRLHPVLPSNSRMAVQDSILPTGGGKDGKSPVFVSAGTTVAFSSIALQRRKDLWGEDAEEFRPERWEHEKSGWKFIPFSGGPRKCIGQEFALNEATYTLARLVQTTDSLESRDPRPWIEGLSMACTSANGAEVAFVL